MLVVRFAIDLQLRREAVHKRRSDSLLVSWSLNGEQVNAQCSISSTSECANLKSLQQREAQRSPVIEPVSARVSKMVDSWGARADIEVMPR